MDAAIAYELKVLDREFETRARLARALGRSPSWVSKTLAEVLAGREPKLDPQTEEAVTRLFYLVREIRRCLPDRPDRWVFLPQAALGHRAAVEALQEGQLPAVMSVVKEEARVNASQPRLQFGARWQLGDLSLAFDQRVAAMTTAPASATMREAFEGAPAELGTVAPGKWHRRAGDGRQ